MEVEHSQPFDSEPTPTNADWQDPSPDESEEERRVLTSFAAFLVGVKLLSLAAIVGYLYLAGIATSVVFLVATQVPFIIAGLALLYLPLSRLIRRMRLRARRRRLIWSEWHVEKAA